MRERIEDFKERMPIIQTLGNTGMKKRHWDRVSDVVGIPIQFDEKLTLAKVIDYGFDEFVSQFEAISEAATKENNLEKVLYKMQSEWADIAFSVNVYK